MSVPAIVRMRDRFQEALFWVESNGIRVSSTRFAQYLVVLDTAIAEPDREARTDDPLFEKVMEAFDSGAELIYLHRFLGAETGEPFRQRLREFVKGPGLQREEDARTSSNRARNLGFELYFGAQLVRAGFRVEFTPEVDVRVVSPRIEVQCKRPQSARKVRSSLRDACRQLSTLCIADGSIGIIALSISKVVHQGKKFLHVGAMSDLNRAFPDLMQQFCARHHTAWQTPSFASVSGVWLHYSGMVAIAGGPTFIRAAFDRVVIKPNPGERYREAGVQMLAEAVEKNNGAEYLEQM